MQQKSRIAKIGNKFYDLGTSNKSFLQLAKDLKTLGIKNYYFMLEIYDYSLVNIDPYACDKDGNSTLSKDQVSRVLNECARNPWYFLREISRIPDQGGTSVRYRANRGNIAQAWCIWKGLDSWLCLPRQQGKTLSALAFQVWMYLFGTTNSQFIFVNKDGDNAKQNLKRMLDQIDLLPEYMRCESILLEDGKRSKAKKNATELGNPVNNNSVIIKPKATSYDSALSLARGLTAPVLHFDEPEFTNHIKTIVSNSVSTFETAASNAKRNNAMYGRIFTCTPGDLDKFLCPNKTSLIAGSSCQVLSTKLCMVTYLVAKGNALGIVIRIRIEIIRSFLRIGYLNTKLYYKIFLYGGIPNGIL